MFWWIYHNRIFPIKLLIHFCILITHFVKSRMLIVNQIFWKKVCIAIKHSLLLFLIFALFHKCQHSNKLISKIKKTQNILKNIISIFFLFKKKKFDKEKSIFIWKCFVICWCDIILNIWIFFILVDICTLFPLNFVKM